MLENERLRSTLSNIEYADGKTQDYAISNNNTFMMEDGFVLHDKEAEKELLSSEKSVPIENWLPVKDIQYGMIITKDNRYVKILEINPVNFFHKPVNEQNSILYSFMDWLKICPIKFVFKCISLKSDPSKIIKNILTNTPNDSYSGMLECRDDYIDHIKERTINNTFTKRFFFIYQYDGSTAFARPDINHIYNTMSEVAARFNKTFNDMGNNVNYPENANTQQAEILYTLLNRNSSEEETFEERLDRIAHDTMDMNDEVSLDNLDFPIERILGQRGFFPNYKDYLVSDGLFYSFFYITSDGFPPGKQGGGWTIGLTNICDGVDIDFYTVKPDRRRTMQDLKRRVKLKRISAKSSANSGNYNTDDKYDAYNSANFLYKSMEKNLEDMFEVSVLITVHAETLNELRRKMNLIIDALTEKDIKVKIPYYKMEEAYLMTLPLLYGSNYIINRSKRNMLTSAYAGMYMFSSSELFDDTGIIAGMSDSNTLMAFNPFNTIHFKNANILLAGTPGAGKTYTEQMIMRRLRYIGVQVIGILPLKAHEYRRGLKHMGGCFVNLSPGSKDCVNIMEIRPSDNIDENLIEGSEFVQTSLLNKKIAQIIIFIQLLMQNEKMNNSEYVLLDEALTHLYNSFGITEDNSSIYYDYNNGILKQMPIIGDLYNLIKDNPNLERITTQLIPFISGSCQNMNGYTNVDLSNDMILFDVEGAGKNLLPAFMFIALDFAYDVVKSNRTKRNMIVLDEVWKIMLNEMAAEFVLELVKVIRGYGGGTMIATQDINDFLSYHDGRYGKGIISSTKIKILLQLEDEEVDRIRDTFKLTDRECRAITKFDRGNAMFMANTDKMFVRFVSTQMEDEDFTTDPNQLREIRDRKLKMKQKLSE